MVIGADDVLLQCHVNIYTDWFFFHYQFYDSSVMVFVIVFYYLLI